MIGIRTIQVLLGAGLAAGLSGCDFVEAFKEPERWRLGVEVEGAPGAYCSAKAGRQSGEGQAPGNIAVPRWVPDPVPQKTKFDAPKFMPLVVSCVREGFQSAELTLRETHEGWTITGIKYWPGHVPGTSIAVYQRSPTAVTVPMSRLR